MKRKIAILVPAAALALAFAILTGRAAANSAAFSFTMHRRAVNGKDNNKLHPLDAGELTLSGSIWVVSKDGGARSTPVPVEVTVKKNGLISSTVCTTVVTPDTIFNAKRALQKSCGHIESGMYWIFAVKNQEDGWHLQGSGSLATK